MNEYFNNKKFRLFKNKTKNIMKKKKSRNQPIYLNQDNNFNTDENIFQVNNNFNQYTLNNQQKPTYIPLNIINNNISSNNRIYQKYYYINQKNTSFNDNPKNAHLIKTFDINFLNEKNINNKFELKKSLFNENNYFDFIKNERNKIVKNNNLDKNNYVNKTIGFKFLNRTISSLGKKPKLFRRNINDKLNSKEAQLSSRHICKNNLNIYGNQLIKIFIKKVNKIIQKIKKKEIMKIFYNSLKRNYYENKYKMNYLNNKYKQKNPKYNEYKNMIYNYIKSKKDLSTTRIYNMLKTKERKKLNYIKINIVQKKEIKEQNKNYLKENILKNEMERLKKLQKKYGNIYEAKKKEILYFEGKTKAIESANSTITDIALLKNKIKNNRNNDKNFSELFSTDRERKEILDFRSFPYIHIKTPIINEKINAIKRKDILNSQSSNKSHKTLSDFRNVYKIYIIKNITTSDKRIYVNIRYISLSNFNNIKIFYPNNMLEISESNNINYIGNNCINFNIKKHKKKLSKIEEEIDDKINSNLSINIRENK